MDHTKSNTRPRARALRLRTPLVLQLEQLEHENAGELRITPRPSACVVCTSAIARGLYATCGASSCVDELRRLQAGAQ